MFFTSPNSLRQFFFWALFMTCCSLQEQDNLSLSRLSEEQREKMEHLELSLDRRQTEAVDSSGLMARLQSDKVAAARALTQNKMLKDQLAELQDGFIMMVSRKKSFIWCKKILFILYLMWTKCSRTSWLNFRMASLWWSAQKNPFIWWNWSR